METRTRFSTGVAGSVDVIVIGAGHSGLAMSCFLTARGIEHLLLERGEIANAWRTERWDSLRLLTPNWMSQLPGYSYDGDDPDGFMHVSEVADFVAGYAAHLDAPVQTHTTVTRVVARGEGYRVQTDRGDWLCRAVVLASGACNRSSVPAVAESVPQHIHQESAMSYRNPDQLPEGGVLVVGASASGLQLAQEIHASGRPVTLAVGEHVRMPRTYRGRDVQWWLNATGVLDESFEEVDDPQRVRRLPSPQLAGTPDGATLDLNRLTAQGVRIAGRLMAVREGKAQFSGSLRNVCTLADLKMNRMLERFDEWAAATRPEVSAVERFEATRCAGRPLLSLDLGGKEIASVVWATGYRPDYSWLDVPALDRKGRLKHEGGVVAVPGLFALGLPFLRRRKSTFMHGAADDARDVAAELASYLDRTSPCMVAAAV